MYVQVYNMQVWLDGMNMNVLFSKLKFYTKIHSNLRKMFVKYTLTQFHFKRTKNCICVPFLYSLRKRFSEILINTCKAAIGEVF